MDQISQWWATTLKGFLTWLRGVWDAFASGVMQDWDLRYFVLGMACFVLAGIISIWRRKA